MLRKLIFFYWLSAMRVSASSYFGKSYVIAIDLNTRVLLWKILISNKSFLFLESRSGQFPIVMNDEDSRVVFSSQSMGVFGLWVMNVLNQ